MERTIRVTGKGKLAVKPDLIELTLSIKDIKKEYNELLKRSSSATNEVKELLEKIVFERKNIKTKSFDSKEKAIVLANASGVKLGNILSIDYSWSELRISSSPFEKKKWFFEEDNDESDYVIDVEIDDIDVTDTVTVIWNIE